MDDKNASRSLLVLLFLPVVLAISGIIMKFNLIDFVYLVLVGIILLRFLLPTKE